MRSLLVLLAACGPGFPPDQGDVSVQIVDLVDASRETPSLGGLGGAPARALPTRLWIGPATGREAPERPLLLMAHGVDGHPEKFEAFATHLALNGVVVAAPAFPSSNRDAGLGLLGVADLAEQPADLRFVLDQLLASQEDPESPVWRRFDPEKVAALGHSLGGATLLGLTRFGEGEPRIRAQAYLSPATLLTGGFGPGPTPVGPPTLLMHGQQDGTLPIAYSEELYAELADPRWFLGIADAGHSDPVEDASEPPLASREAAQDATLALLATAFDEERPDDLPDALAELARQGHVVLP
ncbi:MAG: hypothetical protein H6734_19440 [Alphaproteobacteria bacterium]|nr:hypothetical protein [Alphaproteobacteria bacterium]